MSMENANQGVIAICPKQPHDDFPATAWSNETTANARKQEIEAHLAQWG